MNITTLTPSLRSLGLLMRTALMIFSVKSRKLILTLTFLSSILIPKPKLPLSPLPLRVRRIYLLMIQFLVIESQLLFKAKPSPSWMMPIGARTLSKRMLKTSPLLSNLFFFFNEIVIIWGIIFQLIHHWWHVNISL